jgi:hypothetical protein
MSTFQVARLDPDAHYDADVTEQQKQFMSNSALPPGPECPPVLSQYYSVRIRGINTSRIKGSFKVRLVIKSPDGKQKYERDIPVFNSGIGCFNYGVPEEGQTMSVKHMIDMQETPIYPGDRLFFKIISRGRDKEIVNFGSPVATIEWLIY